MINQWVWSRWSFYIYLYWFNHKKCGLGFWNIWEIFTVALLRSCLKFFSRVSFQIQNGFINKFWQHIKTRQSRCVMWPEKTKAFRCKTINLSLHSLSFLSWNVCIHKSPFGLEGYTVLTVLPLVFFAYSVIRSLILLFVWFWTHLYLTTIRITSLSCSFYFSLNHTNTHNPQCEEHKNPKKTLYTMIRHKYRLFWLKLKKLKYSDVMLNSSLYW